MDDKPKAKGELIERHYRRLIAVIERYLWRKNCNQPAEHAKGVRTSAWISILSHLRDLKDEEKFEGWATTIAINEANRHLNSCIYGQNNSVELKDEGVLPPAQIANYYASRDAAIDAERMLKFAKDISPEFGLVFQLYNMDEIDFEEIARRLGCSKERIRSLYYRGLRKVIAKFNYSNREAVQEQELATKTV